MKYKAVQIDEENLKDLALIADTPNKAIKKILRIREGEPLNNHIYAIMDDWLQTKEKEFILKKNIKTEVRTVIDEIQNNY